MHEIINYEFVNYVNYAWKPMYKICLQWTIKTQEGHGDVILVSLSLISEMVLRT